MSAGQQLRLKKPYKMSTCEWKIDTFKTRDAPTPQQVNRKPSWHKLPIILTTYGSFDMSQNYESITDALVMLAV